MYLDNLSLEEISNVIKSLNESQYRAVQVYDWLYKHNISSYNEMKNIPASLRSSLEEKFLLTKFKEVHRDVSADGTIKFLFELEDGLHIESVLLKDEDRLTGCISSQVGCRMGCKFCATYLSLGFKRDLRYMEIVKQVYHLRKVAFELYGERLSNLVFMGMGEALDNVDNLIKALEMILDDNLLQFSHRRVTVSTSGIIDKIDRLFEMKTPVNLAVSINASSSKKRREIMPIDIKYPLDELINYLKGIKIDNRKRITLEYVLLGGVNDTLDDAKALYKLISGVKAKVNLIIYNESKFSDYKSPKMDDVLRFQDYLISKKMSVFIRKRLGVDIKGACGQLSGEMVLI